MNSNFLFIRHAEVENPDKVIYGRLPNFHLSKNGVNMSHTLKDTLINKINLPIDLIYSSPLERTVETIQPYADEKKLKINIEDKLIEADNKFTGEKFNIKEIFQNKDFKRMSYLRNPFKPSWGEAYMSILNRLSLLMQIIYIKNHNKNVIFMTHQLPIWILRRYLQGKPLYHNIKNRDCNLISILHLEIHNGHLYQLKHYDILQKRDAVLKHNGKNIF